MFTITTIPNNITIGRNLPPTSPAVRLDEPKIRVDGARPLDLAPGESTRVFYPLICGDALECRVTREFMYDDLVGVVRELEKISTPEKESDALRAAFTPSPETVEMLRAMDAPKSSSLAATIERARDASENVPARRRGGRRSVRRRES